MIDRGYPGYASELERVYRAKHRCGRAPHVCAATMLAALKKSLYGGKTSRRAEAFTIIAAAVRREGLSALVLSYID